MEKILEAIRNQTGGYSYGKPWRKSAKAMSIVVPILRDKKVRRGYITLQEAQKQKKIEIKDSGDINDVDVRNKTGKNVFARNGTLLEGLSQPRAIEGGMVIQPEKEVIKIPVRCVNASKGIRGGSDFKVSAYSAPLSTTKRLLSRSGQHAVWRSVSNHGGHFQRMASMSGAGGPHFGNDLVENMRKVDKFKGQMDDAVKDVPIYENQAGAVIFDVQGVVGFEVFDSAVSWVAFHDDLAKKYGGILGKEEEEPLFDLREEAIPRKIAEFIDTLINADRKKVWGNDDSVTYSLCTEGMLGEVTMIKNSTIHVVALRNDDPMDQPKRRQSPTPIPFGGLRLGAPSPRRDGYLVRTTCWGGEEPIPIRGSARDNILRLTSDKPRRFKDFERTFGYKSSTVSRNLSRIVENGLMEKKAVSNGKRVFPQYHLTAKGKKRLGARVYIQK